MTTEDTLSDIYTITLSSVDGQIVSNRDDINYPFDWTILPKGRYEVRFCFLSESVGYFGIASLPQVLVSLNQNNSLTTPSNWGAVPTPFLGVIYPIPNLGNGVNYSAGYLDNPPIILESLPLGNIINVKIKNKNGISWAGNYQNSGYTADMPANSQVITISGPRLTGFPFYIGEVITVAGKTFTLESAINVNPTSGLGTYTTTTANNATAIVASAVTTTNTFMGEYVMTLQLKRIK